MSVYKKLSLIVVIALLVNVWMTAAPGPAMANGELQVSGAASDYNYVFGEFGDPLNKWSYSYGDQPTVAGSFEVVETAEAYEGSYAGRLNADFRDSVYGKPAFVAMRKDLDTLDVRAFSFWVKTTEMKELGIRSKDATGQTFQQTIVLQDTPDWQQVVVDPLTASLHWGGAADGVWHAPSSSIAILMDRGDIKNGALTASIMVDHVTAEIGDWLPELKIRQTALGNVFTGGEPVGFGISTKYPQFQWRVYDLHESLISQGNEPAPGGEGALTLGGMEPGYYMLHVSVQQPGGEIMERRTPFAVLTDYDWDAVEDSPFGIAAHLHRSSMGWSEDLAELIRHAGAKSARGGMEWTIEKSPGEYTFTPNPDSFMNRLEEEGVKGMFVSGYNNVFYDNNATPYTEEGREGFANYANAYVSRYKDQLVGMEIYNEFNGGFGRRGNSPANSQPSYYYELMKKTYETVKADHPDFTVAGMVTAGIPMDWMEQVFQLGGMNYLDVVTVHPYRYGRTPLEARAPEGMVAELDALKDLIREYNGGELKPIWISEIGWPTHQASTGTDEKTQADYLVRAYVVALANGVEKMVWYDLMNDGLQADYNEHNFGIIRFKDDPLGAYTPKPAYVAYAAMTRELTGAQFVEQEDDGSDGIMSYLFQRDGEPVRVLWSLEDGLAAIHTETPIVLTDMTGRSETYEPLNGKVYVSLTGEPMYVKGDIDGISLDDTFALEGEDAVAGEDAELIVTLNNNMSSALSLELEAEGASYPLSAAGGQSSSLNIAVADTKVGERSVIVEVWNGGKKVGKLRHAFTVSVSKEGTVSPQMEATGGAYDKSIVIKVENYSKTQSLQAESVHWEIGGESGQQQISLTAPPQGSASIAVPLPSSLEEGVEYSAAVQVKFLNSEDYGYEGTISFNPVVSRTVSVDGEIDPESAAAEPTIKLADGTVKFSNYGGANDLSGDIWLTYDRDRLYLSAKIKDDLHSAAAKGADIWNNDSIQFAIAKGLPGESLSWYEYGISDTPEGAQVYRWSAAGGNQPGAVSNAQAAVTRTDEDEYTVYELALPWSELEPVKPHVGEAMSFSLLVNENDGNGRRGWIEWASGIGSGKRPSLYRSMQWILPAYEPVIAIGGIAEGESYQDGVIPEVSIVDDSGNWQLSRLELDGEPWTAGDEIIRRGSHTLEVWAESVYGQQMSRAVSFELYSSTILELDDASGASGEAIVLEAAVKDAGGQPVSGGEVTLELFAIQPDGTAIPVEAEATSGVYGTDENGVAAIALHLEAGLYEARVKLIPDQYYNASEARAYIAVHDTDSASIRLNGHFDLDGNTPLFGNKVKKVHLNIGSEGIRIHATPQGIDWTLNANWMVAAEGHVFLQGSASSGGETYTVQMMADSSSNTISMLIWNGTDTSGEAVFEMISAEWKGSIQ
ncbi:hypothetical protein M6D81_03830 [Paenibacillus sp. J5C_2022]|uniref:sugar-binding protein n=1 Tax=Paenibacillus sp. J5C2022 TaxID=2977129 RepID=UPI0021D1096F|nr:sugar-binding protein [Paenibacillus sp. J5C2022]MCU6707832.1 hypothetical protein [Paenibacillus sp. J5C2022]